MNKVRPFVILLFLFIALNFLCTSKADCQTPAKPRPNVIIITIDTLRADHVGCYGYYRNTTPNIDVFSRNAFIFKNAVSQAPFTVSSMASFITSVYSHNHIMGFFPGQNLVTCMLNPHYPTLTKILKNSGYTTCFISDFKSMFYIKGIKQGFDSFIASKDNDQAVLTQKALDWLTGNKKQPFFLWLHYSGAHHPYHPNKSSELTTPLRNKDRIVGLSEVGSGAYGVIPASSRLKDEKEKNINYYINNYDGKVLLVDEQIGLLLAGIKKLGLEEGAVIVITSDHGEEFGEHDLYFMHGVDLYNTMLHVPLLVKVPFLNPAGKNITETVGLIDVVPTVLDLLEIKENTFDGVTLLPLLNGGRLDPRPVFSQINNKVSVVHNQWKLILTDTDPIQRKPPKYSLYNLNSDQYEKNDLSLKNKQELNNLKGILAAFKEKVNQEILDKKLSLFREVSSEPVITTTDQDKEILKSIGYLN